MKRKRYDAEFKKEIAQLYISGSRTGPSLAEELSVHPDTIYKWADQLKKEAEVSITKWFTYYITRRRHSALEDISPLAYEIKRNHSFILSA